jgi:uncharacterized protein
LPPAEAVLGMIILTPEINSVAICRLKSLWSPIVGLCYLALMNQREAISRLKKHEAELRALGVDHLYLFGSTTRGEARQDSDVDLFFDHAKGRLGVYELIDVKERAASILGRRVDVTTRASLHPALRERIEKSAVLIF